MKLYSNDTSKYFLRFSEVLDRYYCVDGRLKIVFKDDAYVEDVETFLTGCLSFLPVFVYIDGSNCEWTVLNGNQKIKTLIDFYENKIRCQGLLYCEMEGYLRSKITDLKIESHIITPGADNKQKLINFLKL